MTWTFGLLERNRTASGGWMIAGVWMWVGFIGLILTLLAIDLGLLNRDAKEVSLRQAAGWTAVWISLAAAFNVFVFWEFGNERGMQFLSGYLLEQALSVDNVFVFSVVFTLFAVPRQYQHRVLFWGILGAIILRGIFIGLGAALIHNFAWVMYIFGAILVYTGFQLFRQDDNHIDPNANFLVRAMRKILPVTDGFRGEHFLVKEGGRWYATPLLVVLVAIEGTDVVFAVDSIPAIFGVFKNPADIDPFIVYTSNIFAILGLRSLYFLVSGMIEHFHYLKIGLAFILIFIGIKMLIAELYHVPIPLSLGMIIGILGVSIIASLVRTRRLGNGKQDPL